MSKDCCQRCGHMENATCDISITSPDPCNNCKASNKRRVMKGCVLGHFKGKKVKRLREAEHLLEAESAIQQTIMPQNTPSEAVGAAGLSIEGGGLPISGPFKQSIQLVAGLHIAQTQQLLNPDEQVDPSRELSPWAARKDIEMGQCADEHVGKKLKKAVDAGKRWDDPPKSSLTLIQGELRLMHQRLDEANRRANYAAAQASAAQHDAYEAKQRAAEAYSALWKLQQNRPGGKKRKKSNYDHVDQAAHTKADVPKEKAPQKSASKKSDPKSTRILTRSAFAEDLKKYAYDMQHTTEAGLFNVVPQTRSKVKEYAGVPQAQPATSSVLSVRGNARIGERMASKDVISEDYIEYLLSLHPAQRQAAMGDFPFSSEQKAALAARVGFTPP